MGFLTVSEDKGTFGSLFYVCLSAALESGFSTEVAQGVFIILTFPVKLGTSQPRFFQGRPENSGLEQNDGFGG